MGTTKGKAGLFLLLLGGYTVTMPATITKVFQYGLDGYTGTKEAELRLRSGTSNPPTGVAYMLITDG